MLCFGNRYLKFGGNSLVKLYRSRISSESLDVVYSDLSSVNVDAELIFHFGGNFLGCNGTEKTSALTCLGSDLDYLSFYLCGGILGLLSFYRNFMLL